MLCLFEVSGVSLTSGSASEVGLLTGQWKTEGRMGRRFFETIVSVWLCWHRNDIHEPIYFIL